MGEEGVGKAREKWLDYVRLLACILVALGHFFQSMVKSGLMTDNNLFEWFNDTIYIFHVPLFFMCSGYLYQKLTKLDCVKDWLTNVCKKLLALGIPYFVFQTATWLLKTVFSSSVNAETDALWVNLFIKPINQFWYLYALFFIFLITPIIKKRSVLFILIFVSLGLKISSIFFFESIGNITPIKYITENEIWFILGMSMQYFNLYERVKSMYSSFIAAIGIVVFFVLRIVLSICNIYIKGQSVILCLIICISLAILAIKYDKRGKPNILLNKLTKYTLPIYLMHTVFAAGFRAVLLKLNITNLFIHCVIGISFSFIGPIIIMLIAKKIKIIDFVVYPTKYIKINKKAD